MKESEYYARVVELSLRFVREKRARVIPENTAWAEWCLREGIYPLERDLPAREDDFRLTPG